MFYSGKEHFPEQSKFSITSENQLISWFLKKIAAASWTKIIQATSTNSYDKIKWNMLTVLNFFRYFFKIL